ncbi:MAG TPA: hypothetical protein VH143_29605 [Kofleriaceae bacterium]|nr:hypothetical protein [Kofleriaceae bacterium]
MRALLLVIAFGSVALGDAPPSPDHYGRQVRFGGIHPIPKSEGGGMCYIEGPHVHIYAANKLEYRDEGPDHVFVGDPAAYGYDGPKVAYKGPHPIVVEVDGAPHTEYCYIDGPHFHPFAPPPGPDFKLVGNAYFYVGAPPQVFVDARPRFVGINAVYEPLAYARPAIDVEAPVGWIGARAEFAPRGRVDVVAPNARIDVVPPSVHVDVRLPPPPTISVGVGVNVGVGGALVVGGHRRGH